jgi:hypothetical protein
LSCPSGHISFSIEDSKEKNVKKYDRADEHIVFPAMVDKGAEIFTKKKFEHAQSKAHEVYADIQKTRKGKIAARRSRSTRNLV